MTHPTNADGAPARPVAPRSALRLERALPPWDGLTAAFASVLAYAAAQVVRAERSPAKAVHEYRKSIRRARALVRLVRPLLKARRYARLDDELRQAVLATSFVRDAEVLGDTLDVLPQGGELAPAIEAVRRLASAQQAEVCTPAAILDVLGRGADRLALLPMRFGKALPARVGADDLEDALRESYRRARRCFRRALAERTDDAIHDWRKRTKELRYQLEMLELPDADDEQPRERALGQVAKGLGQVTDLMVLRASIRAHAGALGAEHVDPLVAALDAMIPARFEEVVAGGSPVFEARAREYARAVLAPLTSPAAAEVPAAPVEAPSGDAAPPDSSPAG